MTGERALEVCTGCGHNRYSDGRCSNLRCPQSVGPDRGFSSLRDILSQTIELPLVNGRVWGRWRLNLTNRTLTHPFYEIDLGAIQTAAHMLDRIYQIEEKRWAGDRDLADLLAAFRTIFAPQSSLCCADHAAESGRRVPSKIALRSPKKPKLPTPAIPTPTSSRERVVA